MIRPFDRHDEALNEVHDAVLHAALGGDGLKRVFCSPGKMTNDFHLRRIFFSEGRHHPAILVQIAA